MKITFNIDYRTNWGESLYIVGTIPELGGTLAGDALVMNYSSGTWTLTVDVKGPVKNFEYRYFVRSDQGYVRKEWGKPHLFMAGSNIRTYVVYDHWQDQPMDKSFYSSMFTDSVFRRERSEMHKPEPGCLNLRVFAPSVRPDEVLAIAGECAALGKWNPDAAVELEDSRFPEWSVSLPLQDLDFPLIFKLIKKNRKTGKVIWENTDNRILDIDVPKAKTTALVVTGLRFNDSSALWKGAGTAIPVFSIRTEEDFGVGDFVGIKRMVDWLALTGQKVLQILPINDTTMTGTWTDSYPYEANSSFALHPMFLHLQSVGILKDAARREFYSGLAAELNALPQVDYERVNQGKMQYAREVFAESGVDTLECQEFAGFKDKNDYWLKPYAAFCVLRDKFGTADFSKWENYSVYDDAVIDKFIEDNREAVDFVYFVQFHLDRQLKDASEYAHAHNVVLKGDIPIGISRTSADAWVNPDLFNMDCQAGAPPDDFSVLGQNWGLPTYNWDEMEKDGFQWWKNRMRKMSEYFDLYRIDHILGFFRIWQIPMTAVHGLLGTFEPALPYTPDEMRYSYDFWIDTDVHAKPFIRDYFLADFFGEFTEEAKTMFLVDDGYGKFHLKEFVDNQAKVVAYFKDKEQTEKNNRMQNALLGLIDQVLFIEDSHQKGKYHPRISAQFTYVYRSLNDYERWCFDRLYNDFFYHRHNDFWYGKAMMKLPALVNSTDMLVCGEDLGMIPDCVPAVMRQLQILSLEIQRMPKDPKVEFGNPYHYPYLSVCTTSTHDMGGIRQWWEENPDKTQRFFNNMLGQTGKAPYFAEPWICDIIVSQHMESPAMLAVLPLQDWLSVDGSLRRENPHDEQINNPAVSPYYWRYRMHLTVERLMDAKSFNALVKNKIIRSGR